MRDELGLAVPDDWRELDDVTDATILDATCRRHGAPNPGADGAERVARRLAALLAEAHAADPGRFAPVPGARHVLDALREAGWRVALATGAWRPSALFKLTAAGIPWGGVPLATSSERPARRDIIALAAEGAGGLPTDAPAVYVGDGVWDGRAARALGFTFVGVGRGEGADRLREAGATRVLPDFADRDAVRALAHALRDGTPGAG